MFAHPKRITTFTHASSCPIRAWFYAYDAKPQEKCSPPQNANGFLFIAIFPTSFFSLFDNRSFKCHSTTSLQPNHIKAPQSPSVYKYFTFWIAAISLTDPGCSNPILVCKNSRRRRRSNFENGRQDKDKVVRFYLHVSFLRRPPLRNTETPLSSSFLSTSNILLPGAALVRLLLFSWVTWGYVNHHV